MSAIAFFLEVTISRLGRKLFGFQRTRPEKWNSLLTLSSASAEGIPSSPIIDLLKELPHTLATDAHKIKHLSIITIISKKIRNPL